MFVVALAMAVFVVGFCVHLAWWRIRKPARQARAIVVLYAALLALVFLGLSALVPDVAARLHAGATGFRVLILYSAIVAAYASSYPAIEADSPSLRICQLVGAAGAHGLRAEELAAVLGDAVTVEPRIDDLVRDRLAVVRSDRYFISSGGRVLARVFAFQRRALRLPRKGG